MKQVGACERLRPMMRVVHCHEASFFFCLCLLLQKKNRVRASAAAREAATWQGSKKTCGSARTAPAGFTLANTARETSMRPMQPTSCTGGERFCACPQKRRMVRGSLRRERTRALSASHRRTPRPAARSWTTASRRGTARHAMSRGLREGRGMSARFSGSVAVGVV